MLTHFKVGVLLASICNQVELTYGSRVLGPSSIGAPEYIGSGAYRVSYVALKVSAGAVPYAQKRLLATITCESRSNSNREH